VWLFAVIGAMYFQRRGRIPRIAIATIVFYFLFFQVGKNEFRDLYWRQGMGSTEGGTTERLQYFVHASLDHWAVVFEDPSIVRVTDLLYGTLQRLSLLEQSANVVQSTPSYVPYQHWKLYQYLIVGLVPRAIWADKPSMNDANRFYQVAYGMSSASAVSSVSIAVGVLAESYISFGWYGVVCVMFLVGALLAIFSRWLLSRDVGLLLNAAGFALLPLFLTVESQAAAYVSGIPQRLLLILVAFYPVLLVRRAPRPARASAAAAGHNMLPLRRSAGLIAR
jgi:hypothetical protein